MTKGSTGSRTPWTRRIGLTAAAAIATVALAGPGTAQAATPATPATPATVSASAAEDVDHATWQRDCQALMDEALPYLKQRIAAASKGEKPAIVFDIDNTTLETDFGFSYPSPANAPVLKVRPVRPGPRRRPTTTAGCRRSRSSGHARGAGAVKHQPLSFRQNLRADPQALEPSGRTLGRTPEGHASLLRFGPAPPAACSIGGTSGSADFSSPRKVKAAVSPSPSTSTTTM